MPYLSIADICSLFSCSLLSGHLGLGSFQEGYWWSCMFLMHRPPWRNLIFQTQNCLEKSTFALSHNTIPKAMCQKSPVSPSRLPSPVLCLEPMYTMSTGPYTLWVLVRLGQGAASKDIRGRRVWIKIYFSGSSLSSCLKLAGNFTKRSLSRNIF